MSYATRGNSGIPRDTKQLANLLLNHSVYDVDLLISPKEVVSIQRRNSVDIFKSSKYLGAALRENPGKLLGGIFNYALLAIQSISIRNRIVIMKIDKNYSVDILKKLGIFVSTISQSNLFVAGVSLQARFARPSFLPRFRIANSEYDIFIQQQIDPINVNRKIKHVIRIHDILPLTHPQYFDSAAVKLFSKGLKTQLLSKKTTWVFDTKASADEFINYFGRSERVFAIPCIIDFPAVENKAKKLNQIIMVNTIEPRKRVQQTINSFLKAQNDSKSYLKNYKLIIIGKPGWQEEKLILDLRKGVYGNSVVFLENINDASLIQHYQDSKYLISASTAEGFGLPPLEGMYFGCIPIVTDIPQHKETIGQFGIYFDAQREEFSDVFRNLRKYTDLHSPKSIAAAKSFIEQKYGYKNVNLQWEKLLNQL